MVNSKLNYFIGIDVSRDKLDFAVFNKQNFVFHREINNSITDIKEFLSQLKKIPGFTFTKSLFVMEHTGIYCNHLLKTLSLAKTNFAQENALQIKKSSGVLRGKDDKTDSIRIAQYALLHSSKIHLWRPKRNVINLLSNLSSLRSRLKKVLDAIKKPIIEQTNFVGKGINKQSKALCKNSLVSIEKDISAIDKEIERLIREDANLSRLNQIITSVPNVGINTSIQIILATNEFTQINTPKKFACYAGIAPFKKESGLSIGRSRVSHIANKKIKSLLHMCAMAAVRKDSEIKRYYKRKIEVDGKPKMLVLNAIRFKLILRIFACLKQNRLYYPSPT
jgi:transposase